MANKMTLEEWRKACGLETYELAERAGVTTKLIREAEDAYGVPVARLKAEAICTALSKEHGRPVTIADIKGLKIC